MRCRNGFPKNTANKQNRAQKRREGDLNSRGVTTRGFRGHRPSGLDYLGKLLYLIERLL